MSVNIGTEAIFDKARWQQQGSQPDQPEAGFWNVWFQSDGGHFQDENGTDYFILTSQNTQPDTTIDLGTLTASWRRFYTNAININDTASLVLASGEINPVAPYRTNIIVSAESGMTDDMDYLNPDIISTGDIVILRAATGNTITLKNGTGNLSLGSDIALTASMRLMLQYDIDSGDWHLIGLNEGATLAPIGATYITQTPNGSLTNEQALSALATGIVYNTTGTGVLSIAIPGTDYIYPAGVAGGQTIVGGTAASQNLVLSSTAHATKGYIIANDAEFLIRDNVDNTKTFRFEATNITTATQRTIIVPDADFTLVGTDTTQTLTNKTISGASNTFSNIAASSIVAGTFGAGNYTFSGTLMVDGAANAVQLTVQANATQTANLAVYEDSSGTDLITFSGLGGFVFNEAGNDTDSRIEGDADANLTVWDAGVDEVVIGSATVLTSKLAVYVASASKSGITIKSTDNSTTNPVLKGLDSSAGIRWSIDYTGSILSGRTSGGTSNGNILLVTNDAYPSIQWRSGTTVSGELIVDVAGNAFFYNTAAFYVRTLASVAKFLFNTTTGILNIGLTGSASTSLHVSEDLATTTVVKNQATLYVGSTGTPAAGHGTGLLLAAESSTTANREQVRLRSEWTTATDASRKARGTLSAYDTAERNCIMWEASGTVAMVGFFGTAPIVKPTALTTTLTSITHTAPGTPDYAIQDLTNSGGYGFVTKDEGNTVLSVILNLQTRVNELETKLQALGLLT